MEAESAASGELNGAEVGGGMLDGVHRLVDDASKQMLRDAKPATRFVLKKLPGGPAFVYDVTQLLTSPNKTRTAFGLAGGALGAAAGGALGAAAGGVNAPIGAALGSSLGENLGEQIYDEHAADIDRGLDATKQWIADRRRQLQGDAR